MDESGGMAIPRRSSSILVRTAGKAAGTRRKCFEALDGDVPGDPDVFVVTSDPRPQSIVDEWYERLAGDPSTFGVVALGASMRSSAARSGGDGAAARNVVRGVADLDGAVDVLAEWASGATRTVILVDSLTTMLPDVGRGAVVGLIDGVASLVGDGVGYFAVDPDRSDADAIAVLSTAVDAVVDLSAGATWPAVDDAVTTIGAAGSAVPVAAVFDVLSDRRRRAALHALRRSEAPVSIATLAERIVAAERERDIDPPDAAFERVYVGLVHVHLPRLEEASLVTVDRDAGMVEATARTARLEPHLSIAAVVDGGG